MLDFDDIIYVDSSRTKYTDKDGYDRDAAVYDGVPIYEEYCQKIEQKLLENNNLIYSVLQKYS